MIPASRPLVGRAILPGVIPSSRASTRSGFLSPPEGTVERWCFDFVLEVDLERKLRPAGLPAQEWESEAPVRRLKAPGRPDRLRVVSRSPKTPRPSALVERVQRARMMHVFLHHELQAAELFAWAVLAFPGTPREFRAGLVRLLGEELLHLALYREHLSHLGACYGDFPVRDWFWERVPSCQKPEQFVALVGLGLEAANLEHSARFAGLFRAAGDPAGADIIERVEREEVGHVAFGVQWFQRFVGPLNFEKWAAALPAPLTPSLLRGKPLNRKARRAAGLDEDFLRRLDSAPATGQSRGKSQG